jgi:hypothetical protein
VTTSHPDNQARHLVARSDRGYVTEPTVDALAACIEHALADASLGNRPTEAWIEEFDWNAVAAEYREALTASIASGQLRPRGGGRASASQRKGTKQDTYKRATLRAMRRYQARLGALCRNKIGWALREQRPYISAPDQAEVRSGSAGAEEGVLRPSNSSTVRRAASEKVASECQEA